jgi:transcriptional regulator with XRE-family HTH domain
MLGMKQPQYFRYEQGYRDIPTDILIKLADLYGTTTDYLLGRTNNSKPMQRRRPHCHGYPVEILMAAWMPPLY